MERILLSRPAEQSGTVAVPSVFVLDAKRFFDEGIDRRGFGHVLIEHRLKI